MDSTTVLRATSFLGVSSSIWLSGISFSQSYLTIPLLVGIPSETSTALFKDLYYSGAKLIVPLALTSTLSTATAAYLDAEKRAGYAVAAAATISILPFTAAVMFPCIHRLIAIADDAKVREKTQPGEVAGLLTQWKWMNYVRAGLSGVGGVVGLLVYSGSL
ncbi:hypothetical protein PV08_00945 [Exophiala spinifera]|uniref:DUF1772 domain-containing protein n=1 Tax=Exophiala spinifera TaxID=91928 RepID=A0A0D2BPC8_9EURO|nr:uncharacterized protein PV08_00945 [Exophiala spinifera]KIW20370.1 hypothetical protein PV08_00945 [Exophiala spinifera]